MSSSVVPCQARHLLRLAATAAASAVATTASSATFATAAFSVDSTTTPPTASGITASEAKSKLKALFDLVFGIQFSESDLWGPHVYSRYVHDHTAQSLAKSLLDEDIQELLEAHLKNPEIKDLSTLISSFGLSADHALIAFHHQLNQRGIPPSTRLFVTLLSAYIQSNEFDDVLKEIPKMYEFSPCKIIYGVLVKSLCDAGKPDLAIETLKEMEAKNIEITKWPYTYIMSALYKQGRHGEGEKICYEMVKKGYSVGPNCRIRRYCDGDPENVKGLIEEMTNSGIKLDTTTYNYLIERYCKAGKMDEAMEVLDKLEEYGCKPNRATFGILIYHMEQHGRCVEGYKVFNKSVQVDRIPTLRMLRYLIKGLVEQEKMKEAKGMSQTIKNKFPPFDLKWCGWAKLEKELGLISDSTPAERGA